MNRNDPVLKRAIAALHMEDELIVRYQLDALQQRLDEIAAMAPHQPFADAEIRGAQLVAHSIYQKLLAREWYEDVRVTPEALTGCGELRTMATTRHSVWWSLTHTARFWSQSPRTLVVSYGTSRAGMA